MSVQAIAWVAKQECGGPSGKVLLYALANYADEHGRCWPSQKRLAEDTELSDRSIRTWIGKLAEMGLLCVEKEARGRSHPAVIVLNLAAAERRKQLPPENISAGNSCAKRRKLVQEKAETGSAPYKEEPSLEPSLEPSGARKRATRLPEGWRPSGEDWQYGLDLGLTSDECERLLRDMKDWSATAPAGKKLDWSRTWQVWVRREADKLGRKPAGSGSTPKKASVFVELGSDEWDAWKAYKGGARIPVHEARADDGTMRRGWYFESRWPPGMTTPTRTAVNA